MADVKKLLLNSKTQAAAFGQPLLGILLLVLLLFAEPVLLPGAQEETSVSPPAMLAAYPAPLAAE